MLTTVNGWLHCSDSPGANYTLQPQSSPQDPCYRINCPHDYQKALHILNTCLANTATERLGPPFRHSLQPQDQPAPPMSCNKNGVDVRPLRYPRLPTQRGSQQQNDKALAPWGPAEAPSGAVNSPHACLNNSHTQGGLTECSNGPRTSVARPVLTALHATHWKERRHVIRLGTRGTAGLAALQATRCIRSQTSEKAVLAGFLHGFLRRHDFPLWQFCPYDGTYGMHWSAHWVPQWGLPQHTRQLAPKPMTGPALIYAAPRSPKCNPCQQQGQTHACTGVHSSAMQVLTSIVLRITGH
jgi:hypothetical protein